MSKWLKGLDADFSRKFRAQVRGIVWNPEDAKDVSEETEHLLILWLAWREQTRHPMNEAPGGSGGEPEPAAMSAI